jgi:hypothetical protein
MVERAVIDPIERQSFERKIEVAMRSLEREAAQATRLARQHEGTELRFLRRAICTIRVVLHERKSAIADRGWRVIVMSLLVKVIASVRAADVLARRGHTREMSIIIRSALESLITALFIAKRDSRRRARRWARHAVVIGARALEKRPELASTPDDVIRSSRILAKARRLQKLRTFPNPQFWASGLSMGSVRDLAVDVGLAWYYDSIYWYGSQSTHNSPIGLDGYVDVLPDGKPRYKLGLSIDGLTNEVAICCDLLVRTLALVNRIGRLRLDARVAELAQEHSATFGSDLLAPPT